jgi:hypothetical protein
VLSLVTQLERKEEMSAYPSDVERFVRRTGLDEGLAALKRPSKL